jgi:threonine dehydrogenase-like Zn-dependent dehydrogenase
MTTKYITMNRITERGSWYIDTHLTHEEALATQREQRIDYPGSVTRILKVKDDFFTDVTDELFAIDQIAEEKNAKSFD